MFYVPAGGNSSISCGKIKVEGERNVKGRQHQLV